MSKYINYSNFLKDFFDISTTLEEFLKDKKITFLCKKNGHINSLSIASFGNKKCKVKSKDFCQVWINELKPTLNKNTNLCITEKERDRIKYVKNREKILESVSKRRVLKRDEINSQKLEHYHLNKERILNADKEKRKILRETVFEIYKDSPNFTEDSLNKYKIIELKSIAKKFDLKVSPKVKDALINKILDKQKKMFAGTPFK